MQEEQRADGPSFAYSEDLGPGFWGEISSEWEDCGMDTMQSPIHIRGAKGNKDLKPLILDLHENEINLMNNGHTIEQEYEPGSTLFWEGVEYELLQFHFHTFSEHVVKRKRGIMEMHAVFRDEVTGNLVVIGQLFKIGRKSKFLANFSDKLPEMKGDHVADRSEINLADGLRNTKHYYTYQGSLTTPPCSPIVTWIILKKWDTLSRGQLHAFRDIMGNNFRPLQNRGNRIVHQTPKRRLYHYRDDYHRKK